MRLSRRVRERLRSGRAVAAELTPPHPGACAYLVIIPQCPGPHEAPERWVQSGIGAPRLRDPSDVTGYEIRYFQHRERYTEEDDWGWDDDQVIADPATRIRRIFVRTMDEIAPALMPWSDERGPVFPHPREFEIEGSLLGVPIESYLDRPDDYPHLSAP